MMTGNPTPSRTTSAALKTERPRRAPAGNGRDPLAYPEAVQPIRVRWSVTLTLLAVHLLALTAALPWLFSWSGLILMGAGLYVFGTLGINLCYHRLLTHRSFRTPGWVERALTRLGFCNLQGSSIRWVTAHRRHHQHSDHRPDPHSPLVNFLWSHVGWLLVDNPDVDSRAAHGHYAADLVRDPFHRRMERRQAWIAVWAAHAALLLLLGFTVGLIASGSLLGGLQLGLSWLIWGVMVRTVLVWHITWAINSVTHIWGYRNYRTSDDSRNNWLLGYISMGEGWHNNHHADQRSAAHGHRWWEFDATYLTVLLMQKLRLASAPVRPTRHAGSRLDLARKRAAPSPDRKLPIPQP